MTRPKRSSVILQKAEKRQAGLQSIDPLLNLGNQLTLDSYSILIETLRSQIATYNRTLSSLDDQSRQLKETEQQLRNLTEQMLLGVAAKYGKNSREYGKAGGIPKSERRRPVRKTTQPNSETQQPAIAASENPAEPTSLTSNGNGNGKVPVSS
jgi:hypothetical protein